MHLVELRPEQADKAIAARKRPGGRECQTRQQPDDLGLPDELVCAFGGDAFERHSAEEEERRSCRLTVIGSHGEAMAKLECRMVVQQGRNAKRKAGERKLRSEGN